MDFAFIRKKGRRERRVGCRENGLCRGAVMKGYAENGIIMGYSI